MAKEKVKALSISEMIGTVLVLAALLVCLWHSPALGCASCATPAAVTPTNSYDFFQYQESPIYHAPTYQPPVYEAPVYEAPTYNPPVYSDPKQTEPATAESQPVSQSVEINQNTEIEEKRDLPMPAPLPGPVQPSFAMDPTDEVDFRVIDVSDVVYELGPDGIEYQEAVRLSNRKAKIADSLLRSRFKKTNWIRFSAPPAGSRFLGWCPVYSESNDITSMNLVGNAGVFACDHGATHAVLVKAGSRRAGTFDGWHIGLGSSAMGIGGDSGASAFGGSASIGPGYTSAESVRVDRPYAVFKLYVHEPTAQQTERKE